MATVHEVDQLRDVSDRLHEDEGVAMGSPVDVARNDDLVDGDELGAEALDFVLGGVVGQVHQVDALGQGRCKSAFVYLALFEERLDLDNNVVNCDIIIVLNGLLDLAVVSQADDGLASVLTHCVFDKGNGLERADGREVGGYLRSLPPHWQPSDHDLGRIFTATSTIILTRWTTLISRILGEPANKHSLDPESGVRLQEWCDSGCLQLSMPQESTGG